MAKTKIKVRNSFQSRPLDEEDIASCRFMINRFIYYFDTAPSINFLTNNTSMFQYDQFYDTEGGDVWEDIDNGDVWNE